VGQLTRTVASSLCGSSVSCPVASACVGGGFAIDSPQAGDHVGPIRHGRRGRCPPRLHLLRRCRIVRSLSVASERPKHPDCGSNPVQSRIPRQYFGFNVHVYTHVPRASFGVTGAMNPEIDPYARVRVLPAWARVEHFRLEALHPNRGSRVGNGCSAFRPTAVLPDRQLEMRL
jgi:hypothetical protein